jgi:hypothetical protein
VKREGVEFSDGNVENDVQKAVLMAALNGYDLRYEGDEGSENKGSD